MTTVEDQIKELENYKLDRLAYLNKWKYARDCWYESLIDAENEIRIREKEIREADITIGELSKKLALS